MKGFDKMKIESLDYGKKQFDETDFDLKPLKYKPNSETKTFGEKHNIIAFDFEVLTINEVPNPVLLSYAKCLNDGTSSRKNNVKTLGYNEKWENRSFDDGEKYIEIIEFLTNTKGGSKGGSFTDEYCQKFFYNIKYDMGIFFKTLPTKNFSELVDIESTFIKLDSKGYEIRALGNMSFSIQLYETNDEDEFKKVKRSKFTYFDMASIAKGGLDKNVKQWVNEYDFEKYGNIQSKGFGYKANYDLIKSVFNSYSNKNFDEYFKNKYNNVYTALIFNEPKLYNNHEIKLLSKKYCENDCKLTALLSYKVKSEFISLEIPFVKPYSTASLFKAFIGYHNRNKNSDWDIDYPLFNPFCKYGSIKYYDFELEDLQVKIDKWESAQSFAYQGYYGGRFEFFERGYFKKVYGLDYASMYPSIQRDLPNLMNLYLKHYTSDELLDFRNDTLLNRSEIKIGLIKAKVSMNDKARIGCFAVKGKIAPTGSSDVKNKVCYPVLKKQVVTISLKRYEYLISDNYPHITENDIEIIESYLFFEKKAGLIKHTKKPFDFLNRLYEKRIDYKNKYPDGNQEKIIKLLINSAYGVNAETNKAESAVYNSIIDVYKIGDSKTKGGRLFNPIYAFLITEYARLKILQDIFDFDLETEVKGIATDCIYLTEKGYNILSNTDRVRDDIKTLGKLETDYNGEMIVIGNGIYQFKNANGDVKITARGYSDKYFPNLFDVKSNPNEYDFIDDDIIPVKSITPYTWKSSRGLSHKIKRVGLFETQTKLCRLNLDVGRKWTSETKVRNILYNNELGTILNQGS